VALGALAPYLPPTAPPGLSVPGAIEAAMQRAGLTVADAGNFEAALHYPSHALALRAFLSAGIATRIERQAGPGPVRAALARALRPFVRPDGTISLSNDFRWVRGTR
jgi:hypothetical protein